MPGVPPNAVELMKSTLRKVFRRKEKGSGAEKPAETTATPTAEPTMTETAPAPAAGTTPVAPMAAAETAQQPPTDAAGDASTQPVKSDPAPAMPGLTATSGPLEDGIPQETAILPPAAEGAVPVNATAAAAH
ncbi:MAG: hypothetical protein M1829_000534 [Trizodia sp. TS-e1964]|nr:MAG: hypothetical protein M1829_000534 [Trizodia sp. TS-e1964]